MKYVVLEVTSKEVTREIPIIFPESLVHLEVATVVAVLLNDNGKKDVRPVSAGFISCIDFKDINCHGESTSLGLKSRRDEDNRLISMMDYLHGIVN